MSVIQTIENIDSIELDEAVAEKLKAFRVEQSENVKAADAEVSSEYSS